MPHIYMLLRIGGDKTVMICNTRVPHITSGLRLYTKRVKRGRNDNINYPFVCYVTNKHVLSFVKYLFKTMHHSHALKYSGTDITLDQIWKSSFCCPRYGVLLLLVVQWNICISFQHSIFQVVPEIINDLRYINYSIRLLTNTTATNSIDVAQTLYTESSDWVLVLSTFFKLAVMACI